MNSYREQAVRFRAAMPSGREGAAIRVAATLLTCRVAVAVLNDMRLPAELGPVYRFVNVHNPAQRLRHEGGRWCCDPDFDEHPVYGINWPGARLICAHLQARLPSAREWEAFASNNDAARTYPWGDAAPTHERANYDEYYGGTTRVGSFAPSELGLYDLAGNLSEWCSDANDAPGRASLERVVKGGAWSKDARHLAIGARRGKWSRLGTTTIGLRPVWDEA